MSFPRGLLNWHGHARENRKRNENLLPLRFLALIGRRMARSGPFSCSNNILLLVRTEIVHAILYQYIRYFSFMPRIKVHNFLDWAMTVLKLPKLAPRCSFSTLE